NSLPDGAVVGVVRQSSRNRNLLFAGTEMGLYVSFDGGKAWHHLDKTGLPKCVRVDDLVIHPRERELVIATHGRGLWVLDIAPLQEVTPTMLAENVHLFEVKSAVRFPPGESQLAGARVFQAPNPPRGASVWLYIRNDLA